MDDLTPVEQPTVAVPPERAQIPPTPPVVAQASPPTSWSYAASNADQTALATEATSFGVAIIRYGRWFYWIAGLSILNSIVALAGGGARFCMGLGVTTILDAFTGQSQFAAVKVIGFLLNLFIAGVYVLFGYFATQRQKWAFITGMVLYALDAVILITAQDFLSVAMHLLALYYLFLGHKACMRYAVLEQQLLAAGVKLKINATGRKF